MKPPTSSIPEERRCIRTEHIDASEHEAGDRHRDGGPRASANTTHVVAVARSSSAASLASDGKRRALSGSNCPPDTPDVAVSSHDRGKSYCSSLLSCGVEAEDFADAGTDRIATSSRASPSVTRPRVRRQREQVGKREERNRVHGREQFDRSVCAARTTRDPERRAGRFAALRPPMSHSAKASTVTPRSSRRAPWASTAPPRAARRAQVIAARDA